MQIKSNITTLKSAFRKAVKQVPFAAMMALNETGKVLLVRNRVEMKRQFKDPVPYTLNAFFMRRSSKANLKVSIERKSAPAGKHYLEVQHRGGVRTQKAVERLVRDRVAYQGIVGGIVPVKGNGGDTPSGGIRMSEINRALAGLNASFSTTAYTRNKQRAAESKLAQMKKPHQYFVKSNESGTSGGIYKRTGKRTIKKIFTITDSLPSYKPNFPFHDPLRKQANAYFPNKFARQFRIALRTAR